MKDCYIIRYGEISIKGLNRKEFEKLLVRNIKDCLAKNNAGYERIGYSRNRILVYSNSELSCLRRVFGVDSISKAIEIELSLDYIKDAVDKLLDKFKGKIFKVVTKRMDKGFELNSYQISEELGAYILDKTDCKVDVKNPEITLFVEIGKRSAYVFTEKIKCVGGLPVGIEGEVYVLIENNGSLLAALLAMKRGCSIKPVSFGKFDISLLEKYAYGQSLNLGIINNIRELKTEYVKAMFTGDKIEDLKTYETKLTVLRPLVGMDEKQINEKLGYYESLCR